MSDEESFVILGTSPMPSLTSMQQQQQLQQQTELDLQASHFSSFRSLGRSTIEKQEEVVEEKKASMNDAVVNSSLINSKESTGSNKNSLENGSNKKSMENGKLPNGNSSKSNSAHSSLNGPNESLAASFILGEVNADVLKTSVYSQFPSLCSMEACADDVVKLQNLMAEYVELKNTLTKVNMSMDKFYKKTRQWKDEMQQMEQNYQQQLQECQQQISLLRDENIELKRDLNTQREHLKVTDKLRQKEHDEMVMSISEKSSMIENMRTQIIKLEQQQLSSYEFVAQSMKENKETPEYIDKEEHQRVIKQFERELSELLAKNLDLSDVQNQYIDEINCLKVKVVAAEELIKKHQADIALLQADKVEKTEEIALLRQQVDVYRSDFEMERNARQNAVGEKDQLLQDLRAMQIKNKELLQEETKKQLEALSTSIRATPEASTSANRSIRVSPEPSSSAKQEIPANCCPVCNKSFTNIKLLQSHVNDCLDKE